MHVVVIGAGVVGVTTAYYLAEDGHEVTVVERDDEAASATSYANAGLLSPGDSYAWASPDAFRAFLKSLYRRDLGIKYRPRLDPDLWSWSLRFLFECTEARARLNTLRKLRITLYARDRLSELVARTGIDFDLGGRGLLYLFRSEASLARGTAHLRLLADHGLRIESLDPDGVVRRDPGLRAARERLAGGVFSPMDRTGDCRAFTRALARWCAEARGVTFAYGTEVTGFEVEAGRIRGLATSRGGIAGDACVLAAGCESPRLAKRLGIGLPIYPVKGYSVTIPLRADTVPPVMGGVDEDRYVAYSPLGKRLRLACSAEFSGYDRGFAPGDFAPLHRTAKELFSETDDFVQAEHWAGLRPMTPSSVPILGRAGYGNFYLNVGHGHLGWTMACGTGKFLADLVAGRGPEIDPEGLLYEA